jgi:hypothetical protein
LRTSGKYIDQNGADIPEYIWQSGSSIPVIQQQRGCYRREKQQAAVLGQTEQG